jgi:hypothetical protein
MSSEERGLRVMDKVNAVLKQVVGKAKISDTVLKETHDQIADIFNAEDPSVDWNSVWIVEEHPDKAPGRMLVRIDPDVTCLLPNWFMEGLAGYQTEIR